MATIVNERDVLIRSAPSRLVDHDLASNVNVPVFKGISLAAPGAIFRLAVNGDVSPTSITATVSHRGFTEAPAITWSVVYGDLTVEPSGTGLTYEMVAANMATDVVTVQASVTVAGMTYTDAIMFVKIQDGSVGLPGSRGTINAVRAITGTAWSTPEAVQALADYGLETPFDPIAGDVVTLHNLNEGFSEIRRFSGSVWVLEAPAFPGRNILKGSVATEQLLVTGMAEALNADPNTVDVSAWSGSGISIVADATAPNGATALRCAGQGTTVLSRRFPVNASDNYQVKTWAKAESGAPTAYLVVAFYDASGAVLPGTANPSGWVSVGDFHYYGLVNEVMPTAWTNYEASFGNDETFKVPAGATHAAVGLVSNFLNGTVQRISGMVCRRKIDGRVVVDGSIAARHIDGRGLTIRNDVGDVLLEAGGDSTPPWVVKVDSSADPGSVSLAAPPDEANRARIRSLLVDNVALKARLTPSNNSVEITATASEVWRMMYSTPITMVPADGTKVLDYASFDVEAGRVYSVELRVVGKAVPSDTSVEIYFQSPAGTTGTLPDGSAFTGGALVKMSTTAMTTAGTTYINPTVLRLLVIVGATAGQVTFHANALGGIRFERGTEFRADRIVNYKSPLLAVDPVATYVTPTTGAYLPSVALQTVTGQPYQATFTATATLRAAKDVGAIKSSSLRVFFDSTTGRVWAGIFMFDLLPMFSGSSVRFYTYDFTWSVTGSGGTTYTPHGLYAAMVLLTGYTSAEADRWEVRVTKTTISLGPALQPYETGYPETSDRTDAYYVEDMDEAPFPTSYPTLNYWPGLFDGVRFSGSPGDVPAQAIIDYSVEVLFMGAPIAPPWTLRTIFNFI